jgi:heme exporter protein A
LLEAIDLSLTRQDRLLFDALSFRVNDGELLVVEGPNGAGKTSLLRVLAGLSLADEGNVQWDMGDTRSHWPTFTRDLAYIGHAPGIKLDLTAEENLQLAVRLGTPRAESAGEALSALGLTDHRDVLCRQLSAGQRRRVALARLRACRSRLWILDEPYTALDRDAVKTVDAMIHEHLEDGGVVVMTSHQTVRLDPKGLQRIRLGDD